MPQTEYQMEELEQGKKQISRFNEQGNRIVVIKIDSFDVDMEMQWILGILNNALATSYKSYQSADWSNTQESNNEFPTPTRERKPS